jgi:hypothetical protein
MKKRATRECSMQIPSTMGAILLAIQTVHALIEVPVKIGHGSHSKFAAVAQGVGKLHVLLCRFSAGKRGIDEGTCGRQF